MNTQSAYAAFGAEVDAGQGAPDWVQVFPAGPDIEARDGRKWRLSDPQPILDAFAAYKGKLPIDWEHANDDEARRTERRPAAGWIAELAWREDGMWARVEWSDEGRADIAGLRYRYISPSFLFHRKTLEIASLTGAGLVNHPAMEMRAIASIQTGGPEMDTEIRQALGLPDTAGVAEAVTAITALKTTRETAGQVDLTRYTPKPDHDAALARIADFEARETAAAEAALSAEIDKAVAAGKITPGSKEDWSKAAASMGVAAFASLMEKQPVILAPGQDPATAGLKPSATGRALSGEQTAIAAAFGLTPEDLKEDTA